MYWKAFKARVADYGGQVAVLGDSPSIPDVYPNFL